MISTGYCQLKPAVSGDPQCWLVVKGVALGLVGLALEVCGAGDCFCDD